jgi:rhodanese-related sulfurtransferase
MLKKESMMENPVISEAAPVTVHENLRLNRITLVDVREPHEFMQMRIKGAFNFPLSTFDPHALPVSESRPVILHCGTGKRSLKALQLCQEAKVPVHVHMAGGVTAWRGSDLPLVAVDPSTGQLRQI